DLAGTVAIAVAVVGDALDGDHLLALVGLEDAHALSVACGDAHVVHRAADQLAAVGHQHDLVAVLDREGGDEGAVAIVDDHGGEAFAATPRDPVLVGRRAL